MCRGRAMAAAASSSSSTPERMVIKNTSSTSNPPATPRNLHLYRLSPLLRTTETSILHLAAGKHCVALATSSNTLVLLHTGAGYGPPITRQVQWFSGALKGIASMAMRDDTNLLVATHDASAFVLPLEFMLRRPPLPVHRVAVAADSDADRSEESAAPSAASVDAPIILAPDCAELLAVHGEPTHASVSCCAFCELGSLGGVAAAVGSLDGTVHLISLRRRCNIGKIFAGAPISRLWDLPAASAAAAALPTHISPTPAAVSVTTAGAGGSSSESLPALPVPDGGATASGVTSKAGVTTTPHRERDRSCGCLLARTLQGKFLLTSLANAPHDAQWRPLVLPRGELTVQPAASSTHGPLLLLHILDEGRLLVYSTALLGESSGRLRPIFTFTLPARTLPGSVHVRQHAIVCAQEHAGGMRALVLSRHLAEEIAPPSHIQPQAATALAPSALATEAADQSADGAPPRSAPAPAPNSAAARRAALRALLPSAILQALPLPKGTVMLLAPLGDAPSLGDFLFASRSTLYALRAWHRPASICRRLLRPPKTAHPPLRAANERRDESRDESIRSDDCGEDNAARVGLAWVLVRTFGLDFDVLSARANAEALTAPSSIAACASPPADAAPGALTNTVKSPHAVASTAASNGSEDLRAAVAVATAPNARSTELLFTHLGLGATGHASARPPVPPRLTPEAMGVLAKHLNSVPSAESDGEHDDPGSCSGDDDGAAAAEARHSAARIDLARLCCQLHAHLMCVGDSADMAGVSDLDATARAALNSAPRAAARILAATGSWQPLLFLLPPSGDGWASSWPAPTGHTIRGRVPVGVPSLRMRLEWLRAAAARDALSLAQHSRTSPQQWARLLAAVETDGADGHMPDDASSAGGAGRSRQCADTCMLLTLALLPQRTSARVETKVAAHPVVGSGALGAEAEVLGATLEVFLVYWLRQPWPVARLAETLRTQMHGASRALCWLLEHRPELVAQAALGPELLLDAIRVAASPIAAQFSS